MHLLLLFLSSFFFQTTTEVPERKPIAKPIQPPMERPSDKEPLVMLGIDIALSYKQTLEKQMSENQGQNANVEAGKQFGQGSSVIVGQNFCRRPTGQLDCWFQIMLTISLMISLFQSQASNFMMDESNFSQIMVLSPKELRAETVAVGL